MSARKTQPAEESRLLNDLRDHPLQSSFFDPLSDYDLRALAIDIKKKLKNKIQIIPKNKAGLPTNTIIDGHQRRRALLLNGETRTTVIVRYDLADVDAATIEKVFLEANQVGRNLDILAKARVAYRLFEIAKKRPRGQLNARDRCDARDEIGKAIGMGGRNLSRYFNALRAPVEIQNALRAREISLVDAERVSWLEPKILAHLAERLRAGEKPKDIIKDYLPKSDERLHKRAGDAVASFARALRRANKDLHGRHEKAGKPYVMRYLSDFRRGAALIADLIAIAEAETGHDVRPGDDLGALVNVYKDTNGRMSETQQSNPNATAKANQDVRPCVDAAPKDPSEPNDTKIQEEDLFGLDE